MKIVARFSTPAEAHVAWARLMSAGVEAEIRDEATILLHWLWSDAIGGVKIEVMENDVLAAHEILALPACDEGILRCPHCGSHETKVRVLSVFGAICVFLKIPIPMTRAIVDCLRCRRTHDVAINGKGS